MLDHLREVLLNTVLPPAVVAAVVAAPFAWFGRRREAILYLGVALALAVAGAEGNRRSTAVPVDRMPTAEWHWLPWVTLAALAVGVVAAAPAAARGVGWSLRGALSAHAGWLLAPAPLRQDHFWVPLLLGAVVLAEWAVLEQLAWRGLVALAMVLASVSAAAVAIHAGWSGAFDVAMSLAGAVTGVALVALPLRVPTRAVAPAVAILLPGLMLSAWYVNETAVPWASFALAALAPLALAPSLWPAWQRNQSKGLWVLQLVLFLLPLAGAIGLAALNESLEYE